MLRTDPPFLAIQACNTRYSALHPAVTRLAKSVSLLIWVSLHARSKRSREYLCARSSRSFLSRKYAQRQAQLNMHNQSAFILVRKTQYNYTDDTPKLSCMSVHEWTHGKSVWLWHAHMCLSLHVHVRAWVICVQIGAWISGYWCTRWIATLRPCRRGSWWTWLYGKETPHPLPHKR